MMSTPDSAQSSILSSVEGCGLRRHNLFGAVCFDVAQHAHIVLTKTELLPSVVFGLSGL